MAFFDKLGDLAKSAGEKAGDAIEIGKLKSKINNEEKEITELTAKIGEYFLARLDEGQALDADVMALYGNIQTCRANIATARKEIEEIKTAQDAPQAAPAASAPAAEQAAFKFCPHCGAKLQADMRFCSSCGTPQQ